MGDKYTELKRFLKDMEEDVSIYLLVCFEKCFIFYKMV